MTELAIDERRLKIDGLRIGDWRLALKIDDCIGDWRLALKIDDCIGDWRLAIGIGGCRFPGAAANRAQSPIDNALVNAAIDNALVNPAIANQVVNRPMPIASLPIDNPSIFNRRSAVENQPWVS